MAISSSEYVQLALNIDEMGYIDRVSSLATYLSDLPTTELVGGYGILDSMPFFASYPPASKGGDAAKLAALEQLPGFVDFLNETASGSGGNVTLDFAAISQLESEFPELMSMFDAEGGITDSDGHLLMAPIQTFLNQLVSATHDSISTKFSGVPSPDPVYTALDLLSSSILDVPMTIDDSTERNDYFNELASSVKADGTSTVDSLGWEPATTEFLYHHVSSNPDQIAGHENLVNLLNENIITTLFDTPLTEWTDLITTQLDYVSNTTTVSDGELSSSVGFSTADLNALLIFMNDSPQYTLADQFVSYLETDYINEIKGTDADDTLEGTDQSDLIEGEAGDDILIGKGDNDILIGGEGRDTFYADKLDLTDETGALDTILDYTSDDTIQFNSALETLTVHTLDDGKVGVFNITSDGTWYGIKLDKLDTNLISVQFDTESGRDKIGLLKSTPDEPFYVNKSALEQIDTYSDIFLFSDLNTAGVASNVRDHLPKLNLDEVKDILEGSSDNVVAAVTYDGSGQTYSIIGSTEADIIKSAGQTIMTGGDGADTFIVDEGYPVSTITDYSADDKISIDGSSEDIALALYDYGDFTYLYSYDYSDGGVTQVKIESRDSDNFAYQIETSDGKTFLYVDIDPSQTMQVTKVGDEYQLQAGDLSVQLDLTQVDGLMYPESNVDGVSTWPTHNIDDHAISEFGTQIKLISTSVDESVTFEVKHDLKTNQVSIDEDRDSDEANSMAVTGNLNLLDSGNGLDTFVINLSGLSDGSSTLIHNYGVEDIDYIDKEGEFTLGVETVTLLLDDHQFNLISESDSRVTNSLLVESRADDGSISWEYNDSLDPGIKSMLHISTSAEDNMVIFTIDTEDGNTSEVALELSRPLDNINFADDIITTPVSQPSDDIQFLALKYKGFMPGSLGYHYTETSYVTQAYSYLASNLDKVPTELSDSFIRVLNEWIMIPSDSDELNQARQDYVVNTTTVKDGELQSSVGLGPDVIKSYLAIAINNGETVSPDILTYMQQHHVNEITGTDADDNLMGTDLSDQMVGNAGDDTFNKSAGDDTFIGGEGSDTFIGDHIVTADGKFTIDTVMDYQSNDTIKFTTPLGMLLIQQQGDEGDTVLYNYSSTDAQWSGIKLDSLDSNFIAIEFGEGESTQKIGFLSIQPGESMLLDTETIADFKSYDKIYQAEDFSYVTTTDSADGLPTIDLKNIPSLEGSSSGVTLMLANNDGEINYELSGSLYTLNTIESQGASFLKGGYYGDTFIITENHPISTITNYDMVQGDIIKLDVSSTDYISIADYGDSKLLYAYDYSDNGVTQTKIEDYYSDSTHYFDTYKIETNDGKSLLFLDVDPDQTLYAEHHSSYLQLFDPSTGKSTVIRDPGSIDGFVFPHSTTEDGKNQWLAGSVGEYTLDPQPILGDTSSGYLKLDLDEGITALDPSSYASISEFQIYAYGDSFAGGERYTATSDDGVVLISDGYENILTGGEGDDVLIDDGIPSPEGWYKSNVDGNGGNDQIVLRQDDSYAHGGDGDDYIVSLGDDTSLSGDAGDDTLIVQSSKNTLSGDEGTDLFTIDLGGANNGTNTITDFGYISSDHSDILAEKLTLILDDDHQFDVFGENSDDNHSSLFVANTDADGNTIWEYNKNADPDVKDHVHLSKVDGALVIHVDEDDGGEDQVVLKGLDDLEFADDVEFDAPPPDDDPAAGGGGL